MNLKWILLAAFLLNFGFYTNEAYAKKPAAKPVAKKPTSKDWPLIKCGKDLKSTAKAIDIYQDKLVGRAKSLTAKQKQILYAGNSVLAESMTLLAPEVFWNEMISTRVTQGCFNKLKALKHAMSTNDSKGTPNKVQEWNRCVLTQYGGYPRQTRQINACIKSGLAYIKQRQK